MLLLQFCLTRTASLTSDSTRNSLIAKQEDNSVDKIIIKINE